MKTKFFLLCITAVLIAFSCTETETITEIVEVEKIVTETVTVIETETVIQMFMFYQRNTLLLEMVCKQYIILDKQQG